MSLGEFKALEQDLGLDQVPISKGFDFDIKDITDTANDWLISLGQTANTYNKVKDVIDGKSSVENEATRREYENIEQNVTSSDSSSLGVNSKYLVYGGIAIAAFVILKA